VPIFEAAPDLGLTLGFRQLVTHWSGIVLRFFDKLSIKEKVIGIGVCSVAVTLCIGQIRFSSETGWEEWLALVAGVGAAAAAVGWWVQRGLGEQIDRLAETAQEVATKADYGVRLTPQGNDEVSRLMHAFNTLLARFQQQVSALEEGRNELESWFEESTRDLMDTNRRLKHETTERRRTEATLVERDEQLKQSQKLEAIGRLAGGVAHDFNNQLAIIRGYVEMALDDLPEKSSIHNDLVQIAKAVQRSTSLTDQLLLFSSRQPMNRRQTVLNHHLEDLQKMLGRLLGEDVTTSVDLADGLWTINADTGNIDQVLTNMSVNARDAMPNGGTLTIATRNIHIDEAYCRKVAEGRPGDFVRLTLADSGIGMSPRVMAKVFEPFYTTKGPLKGTGLGLSVVYGIVQAHEGWITVDSEVGSGSRFHMYFPAVPAEEIQELASETLPGAYAFRWPRGIDTARRRRARNQKYD